MWYCGFYTSNNTCGEKDFLALFFWALAPATFALFMMGQKRIFAAAGAVGYVILVCVLIVPDRPKFSRNLINFILFHVGMSSIYESVCEADLEHDSHPMVLVCAREESTENVLDARTAQSAIQGDSESSDSGKAIC